MKTKLPLLFVFLSLNVFAQLPNPGFENWVNVAGSPFPAGWSGSPFGVDTTTDATQGNNALLIWTWYNYSPGLVYNGAQALGFNYASTGTPYTQKPLNLSGMYKFDTTHVLTVDSITVVVFLKRYNFSTHQRDTVALGIGQLPPAGNYTSFTVPVADLMPGIDPDSIVVLLTTERRGWDFSTVENVCQTPWMDCAYASFDDLQLNTASGLTEFNSLFSPVAYPNPTTEYVSFKYKMKPDGAFETIAIYDNTGKLCYKGTINSMANRVKVKHFGRGMYHYIISSEDHSVLSKGKFTVTD